MPIKEIRPIKETPGDFDEMEARIIAAFRAKFYLPILDILNGGSLRFSNAKDDTLFDAIRKGRITFYRGVFKGQFSAELSKELRRIGARWDRKTKTYRLQSSELPLEVRMAVSASDDSLKRQLDKIDRMLSQSLPAEIAESVKLTDLFERTLWRTDGQLQKSLKGLAVAPKLTKDQSRIISEDWQENMDLWIKDFTEKQISDLRKTVRDNAFSGNRREALIASIKKSYGVTERKAKFLARQETALLMAKFKETRYTDAGVHEYRWGCVAGSPNHPVRPSHKKLEGKIFRWDDPPTTTMPGEPVRRNNPGQDYNCRCFAKPIIRF